MAPTNSSTASAPSTRPRPTFSSNQPWYFAAKDHKTNGGTVSSIAIPAGRSGSGNIVSRLFGGCFTDPSDLSAENVSDDDPSDCVLSREIARFQRALYESVKTRPDASHATHIETAFKSIKDDRKALGLETTFNVSLAENVGVSGQYKDTRIAQGSQANCDGAVGFLPFEASNLNANKKILLDIAAGAAWDSMCSNGRAMTQPPEHCEYLRLNKIRARRISGPQGEVVSWVSVDP